MTPDQKYNREERIGIMVFEGKMTEEFAQAYCDRFPDVYGIREVTERQDDLFRVLTYPP